ncbi:cation/multidrug efflux pump [Schinkia azotoformans MEV2011]|uniref:Cation/multidrug efflux pump n=1 Tax=Schinkia azotoformans MEV2011 TaxID=1348973 RepID=A0A072NL99_SCHAZ|nr:efflux RND transporter permease subunit [Schinkia azotoformans]KEF38226.1 cation/multidrug efflux pump [Schinkia azotoformans MEV2011]MEC1697395.1 efflux RND transporter permease subunit [Schinkia azotoformans]MEC1714284.1 efflux RND transporter permease subunit [Schinkia azotoformans]MEC1723414.1 efflux RND transporter permease subunit [Schinkia azotoformans]MEC1741301.1 efflux RND transporter permease subunit [Schinkia azotoformans]
MKNDYEKSEKIGLSGKIARAFIDSKLTPLLVIAVLLLGVFAVLNTPREEEPQISVPMVDIYIAYPGHTAEDIENRITKVIEKKLWEIDGIEYIYSTSTPGMANFITRFEVGADLDQSLVRLYNKLMSNIDELPEGAMEPLVKPITIDDVPIVSYTLWSDQHTHYDIKRIADVVADEINKIENVSKTEVIGGLNREILIRIDPNRLASYGISPIAIEQTVRQANISLPSGEFDQGNKEYKVKTGQYIQNKTEIENLVIGIYENRPVYVKDVATVKDGPGEVTNYVLLGAGPMAEEKHIEKEQGEIYPAVTISVSKKPNTNAVWIADNVEKKIEDLKGKVIPQEIQVTPTRNYGETAEEKANELIKHLLIATLSVTLLIGVVLGVREAIVVGIAVPVTLALALFLSKMYGYTLNRVTLFALIFAIGILVDDAIVVVENIHRWFQKGTHKPLKAAILAVDEVGNPTILATFTVIATLMPMAFVGGLMGPYMAPIPINASVAMFFSLLVAFIVTPWFAYRFLKKTPGHKEQAFERHNLKGYSKWYANTIQQMLLNKGKRFVFLLGVIGLLLGSFTFFYTKAVPMKMMPFDNKSEIQVVIDMPEGSTLEGTAAATKAIGQYISTINEVTDYEMYIGAASPFNFNGLVRHYYLRSDKHEADIQINLVEKTNRKDQSHDIAKRIRPDIQKIAGEYGANAKVVEVPPGPPVLSTLVLEIYGNDREEQFEVARKAEKIFKETEGVVDVDTYMEDIQTQYSFSIKEKARLNGISDEQIVKTIQMMVDGASVGLIHPEHELNPVQIKIQPEKGDRANLEDIKSIQIPTAEGKLIPLAELVDIQEGQVEQPLYRKNLQSVTYVVGDVAGYEESPAYSMAKMWDKIGAIKTASGTKIEQYLTHQPWLEDDSKMKWDGEWQITYEVFRDLGLAFAVALIVMYLLVTGWFQSFITPLIIMSPIPLTLIGVIPGHWLFGAFFTATSMIGVIALAGIIVRNSILLVEFTIMRRKEGATLSDAVIEAGIVRAKPIILTAAAVVIGAIVILFDPIFSGLAISLMFGTIASTVLTLFVIPVLYCMVETKRAQIKHRNDKECKIECADDVKGM